MKYIYQALFIIISTFILVGCIEEIGWDKLTVISEDEVPEIGVVPMKAFEEVNNIVDLLMNNFGHEPDSIIYGPTALLNEPERIVSVNCIEVVFAIASLLESYGVEPIAIAMGDKKTGKGHSVFLYKVAGYFGSLGGNFQDWQLPIYSTTKELVRAIVKGTKVYVNAYDIFNIRENFPDYDTATLPFPLKAGRFSNQIDPPLNPPK